MAHKCFISFKTEDEEYKKTIQEDPNVDIIDKCLDEPINSDDEDYIMRKIREDYLSDSTVTIFLIGNNSNEYLGKEEQKYIKRELQASLYNGKGNTRNGILGIVLPSMISTIYQGLYTCQTCNYQHSRVNIGDSTTIKEFSRNYYLDCKGKCFYSEDDRYCVLIGWDDFIRDPNTYIDKAFNKRNEPIADKVIVYP